MVPGFKLSHFCSLVLTVSVLAGCAVARWHGEPMVPAVSDDFDRQSLQRAVRQSIRYLQKLPAERVVGAEPRRYPAAEILDSLLIFDRLLERTDCSQCLTREIADRFELIPSSADADSSEVLFTGYYQPVMEGSLTPTDVYRYPIYATPADLMAGEVVASSIDGDGERAGYFSRREIDDLGMLQGRELEIAWLRDPVDVFFLHIQGSGIVRLPDGGQLSVGYAAQNGRAYRSIGRLLIDDGKISKEEMSMQALRRYLAENPSERSEIFAYNESYVFFRVVEGGPLGSLDVPVTAGRTIATDSRIFPKGALVLIETEIPVIDGAGRLAGWKPLRRIMLNQDTGGAIRGLQRADIYFGSGAAAGGLAGYMNRRGRMYFLSLKSARGVAGREDIAEGGERPK